MASGIYENDWMLSTKIKPWHGIGTVVDSAPVAAEAIKIAHLDWTVKQYPVMANGNEIPNFFANVRSDTNEALGIVKDRYRILQNIEAFDFVDGIVSNKFNQCHYETAGSLFNGRKIFLLVKLPDENILGDDVENYLFFTNSHDGSSALTAGISNIRVVCNNTLQLAIKGAKRTWNCRHTVNLADKTKEAAETLQLAVSYIDTVKDTADEMAIKKVNEETFFRNLFACKYLTKTSEKAREETIKRIHTIYHEKDDLQNFKGSAWGMYNAVADFVSNTKPFRQTSTMNENKMNEFLVGSYLLESAQNVLIAA